MRVLVATDRIGPLTSGEAGRCLAEGWSGHDVALVPIGESGAGWLRSLADQLGSEVQLVSTGTAETVGEALITEEVVGVAVEPTSTPLPGQLDLDASSAPLGFALASALEGRAEGDGVRTVAIDLSGAGAHDAGAGFLAALGAAADADLTKGVRGLGRSLGAVDISAVAERLAGVDLVGIVPYEQTGAHLLGLRGITSILGREQGMDTHQMLATDGNLERLVGLIDPAPAALPGAGACGGLGYAVLALGGRLVTGTEHLGARVEVAGLAAAADLAVTGCTSFDFATRGGGAVATIAHAAEQAMTPCIAVAGEVLIGSREMRTMGIEAAYPAPGTGGPDPRSALTDAARRVARSWSW
ncbi:glycerate kinase [Propionibacteriaceae bacterium Y1685]|uniref:glycerate kinase n=1 Tax=Microlunatus sp. Y1700 TaxID=3418487 RepID=UPI003B804602